MVSGRGLVFSLVTTTSLMFFFLFLKTRVDAFASLFYAIK